MTSFMEKATYTKVEREKVAIGMNESYGLTAAITDLTEEFRVDRILFQYDELTHYKPTQPIPVILPDGRERCLSGQRWGLMPYWGKSSIYAHRDSLEDKPYLMGMLARRRCIVPCSGMYFERVEGKRKITYRRKHANKRMFGAAGTFDVWLDSEKRAYPMCTIISVDAPGGGSLPLVLEGEALNDWLDPSVKTAHSIHRLLRSIPAPAFETELVDPVLFF